MLMIQPVCCWKESCSRRRLECFPTSDVFVRDALEDSIRVTLNDSMSNQNKHSQGCQIFKSFWSMHKSGPLDLEGLHFLQPGPSTGGGSIVSRVSCFILKSRLAFLLFFNVFPFIREPPVLSALSLIVLSRVPLPSCLNSPPLP